MTIAGAAGGGGQPPKPPHGSGNGGKPPMTPPRKKSKKIDTEKEDPNYNTPPSNAQRRAKETAERIDALVKQGVPEDPATQAVLQVRTPLSVPQAPQRLRREVAWLDTTTLPFLPEDSQGGSYNLRSERATSETASTTTTTTTTESTNTNTGRRLFPPQPPHPDDA